MSWRHVTLASLLALGCASACAAPTGGTPAAAASATAIPFKHDSGAAAGIGGSALGIVLVSLLAIAAVLVMRKRLRLDGPIGVEGKLLRVVESQRLGPRALLTVVEFDGTRYLLAQSEQGISCVASSPVQGRP